MSQEEKLPKILIVEDDERLARLTQEYLIRNGLEVGVEPDGNRAIRRIIAEQPDMVVLDVMLPGADGLTICREVRPHYHQPILMSKGNHLENRSFTLIYFISAQANRKGL